MATDHSRGYKLYTVGARTKFYVDTTNLIFLFYFLFFSFGVSANATLLFYSSNMWAFDVIAGYMQETAVLKCQK